MPANLENSVVATGLEIPVCIPVPKKVKSEVKAKLLICARLFVTPWTIAYKVPPTMEISR